MEKDKKKKALQVTCTVFVFLCVVFAMYKLIKLDEKNSIQRQKQEETQEKEDKINAKCEAIEYMDEYTENLQDQMRKAGIDDIRVTYKKCSRDYFDEYWGIDEMIHRIISIISFWIITVTRLILFMQKIHQMGILNHLLN